MERTQLYLTEEQKRSVKLIAERLGTSQSEIVRAAVDDFIQEYQKENRLALLRQAFGLWAEQEWREPEVARQELDRFPNLGE